MPYLLDIVHEAVSYRCKWFMGKEGVVKKFSQKDYDRLVSNVIEPMASDGLRTICLAYKDYVCGDTVQENQACVVFAFNFFHFEKILHEWLSPMLLLKWAAMI